MPAGTFVREYLVELLGETDESSHVRRRLAVCGETAGEVGLPPAHAAPPRAHEGQGGGPGMRGREVGFLEGLEVALELPLQPRDLGPGRGELLLEPRQLLGGVLRRGGERPLDEAAVSVELGELADDGCLEPVFRQSPSALARAGP